MKQGITTGRRTQAEMPFLDHLEELRSRLIWSVLALLVGLVLGLISVAEFNVLEIVEAPIRDLLPNESLSFTSPVTPFFITLKLGFIVGLILAFPMLLYQAWHFLAPALYENERRFLVPSIAAGTLLFLAGVAMAYFFVLPFGLKILLGFYSEQLTPVIMIGEYLNFATKLILAFGLIFEMPVILVFLSLLGVVTPEGMSKYRRHAIVAMAVVSAFLTPADPYTMLAMMAPMIVLYELSIVIAKVLRSRRNERTAIIHSEGSTD